MFLSPSGHRLSSGLNELSPFRGTFDFSCSMLLSVWPVSVYGEFFESLFDFSAGLLRRFWPWAFSKGMASSG